MDHAKIIVKTAIISRIALICLQYLANVLIPDHNAHVFVTPKLRGNSAVDVVIQTVLGGFLRWDAHYFVHIARYGYTYENTLAFFPLYPLLGRGAASLLHPLVAPVGVGYDSLLLLVFVAMNTAFFVMALLVLYELTGRLLGADVALKAAILYCINPASVFFVAPYTETIFSYFTFKSMLNSIRLYDGESSGIRTAVPFVLSTMTRSNGLLNTGFLMYAIVCMVKVSGITRKTFQCLGYVVLSVVPFVLFQYYSYASFCRDFPYELSSGLRKGNFILPGEFSLHNQSWCSSRIPLAYAYVQSHYWNVGFLRYYQLKQVPNFLLAFPILYLVSKYCVHFFQRNRLSGIRELFNFELLRNETADILHPKMLVFAVHAAFLSLFCTFNVHIQVSTRMLCSATPVVYWCAATSIGGFNFRKKRGKMGEYVLLGYFLSYFLVGTVMFCNFLPWT